MRFTIPRKSGFVQDKQKRLYPALPQKSEIEASMRSLCQNSVRELWSPCGSHYKTLNQGERKSLECGGFDRFVRC